MTKYILPVGLLVVANVFMTFAWYGHLKIKNAPLKIPSNPFGANGTQLSGFTYNEPTIINVIIIIKFTH